MIYVQKVKSNAPKINILHECAHDLLWQAVSEEYPELVCKLTMRREEHGKPYFVEKSNTGIEYRSNICFNLSHSGEYVACILGKGTMGIDIERIRPYNDKVAKRVLHRKEYMMLEKSFHKDKDFIRFWTLKEAYGKYTGKGIGENLKDVVFSWNDLGKVACSDENVALFQWFIEEQYYLSVCVKRSVHDIVTLTNIKRSDKIYTC